MTCRKMRRILYIILIAFFSLGAVNCSETMFYFPGNYGEPIVNLTRAADDVIISQGFTLNKDMKINIVSLGEGVFDDLTDYGWIIDADTREKVWIMTMEHSKHAGGAKKNRIVDEDIILKKGSYIAFYKTDDSHSYEKWNDDPPNEETGWGLSGMVKNNDDKNFITLFDDMSYKSKGLLAEIVRVKDNDFKSRAFRLSTETSVRVYAIGEGIRSEMFDYGWIENEFGNVLWKMDYKKSRYAGGAVKNRLAVEVLTLPAGEYRIYYKTDDSHSFENWNANPPEDAIRYGLTLTKEYSPVSIKHAGD